MRAALVTILLASQTAVLFNLARRRLFRPFLFFGLYVAVLLVRQVRLFFLDPMSTAYLEFWALTLVFVMPLQILAAGESAYRSLAQFQGLKTTVFAGAGAVSMVLAAFLQDLQSHQTRFGAFSRADQSLTTALFVGGLAFSIGLSWIHPQRRKNAAIHERLLLVHFACLAIPLFLMHRGVLWAGPLSMACSAAGFFAWSFVIREEGESVLVDRLPALSDLPWWKALTAPAR